MPLWTMFAILVTLAASNPKNDTAPIAKPEMMTQEAGVFIPTLIEGDRLPDGRLIILLTRDELDIVNAILESEPLCRKQLVSCAEEKRPNSFQWLWPMIGGIVAFSAGFALSFTFVHH